jgi:uncharacterized SAM-binding protein YcdF (DUF218 family)
VIKVLIDPFNILLFLVTLGFLTRILNLKAPFKWLLIATLSWFFIISTPLIPNLVLDSLESRYVPVKIEQFSEQKLEAVYHIIVLGGGHSFDDRLPPNSLLSAQALARLSEGVRLHRQLPNSKLVLSGYSLSGRTTQAEMLQQTAILLGVEAGNTLLQKEPANTWQEAKIYSERFGNGYPVILVTSAAHMPRAAGAFVRFGVEPLPSPTHYRIKKDPHSRWSVTSWLPSYRNMEILRVALNEHAALFRDSLR